MARLARVVVPGHPHHVTQRGNRRQPTFFSDDDCRAHAALLADRNRDRSRRKTARGELSDVSPELRNSPELPRNSLTSALISHCRRAAVTIAEWT